MQQNPISRLNELCQAEWHTPPQMIVTPPSQVFVADVTLPNGLWERGFGKTKQEAKEAAALKALGKLTLPEPSEKSTSSK